MRLAVLCPSEIAIRRFMPALMKCINFQYVGVGINSIEERYGENMVDSSVAKKMLMVEKEKANVFVENFGGTIFNSYEEVVTSNMIDAVYIPLPPALHFKWAKKALENGKHVLIEKPATLCSNDSEELISIAKRKGLALHENYMFMFHKQLDAIEDIVKSGEIGDLRLYRISFGFPKRKKDDFRYNKELGGGALIDAGGYTIKYANRLLGNHAKLAYANMNYTSEFDVDVYGSAAMLNDKGETVQISYGMDNDYKCDLEVWGSTGSLKTNRVLTAPVDFIPQVTIRKENSDIVRELPNDDTFYKSICYFNECINNNEVRKESYCNIARQAGLVDEFRKLAKNEIY